MYGPVDEIHVESMQSSTSAFSRPTSAGSATGIVRGDGGIEPRMQIDKDQILQLLRSQGDEQKAQQADQELPGKVDTDEHAGLLAKFGIDPMDLIKKFGGGSGLGGLLGG